MIPTPHLNHINPDLTPPPAPTYITNPPQNTCTCRALDTIGSNPTCPDHPWWLRDTIVLDLADHPDGPWNAAMKTFGGGA